MRQLLKNKNLWIFIMSLITTFSISMNVVNGSFMFDGNNFKWILILGILYILFSKAIENANKRLIVCSRNIWIYNIIFYNNC